MKLQSLLKYSLFLVLFTPSIGNAQVVIDSLNGRIYLEQVHNVELTTKQLKEKSTRWVAKSYNNSNYVTRINNEENILTKGVFEVGANFLSLGTSVYVKRNVEYTLDLKFKEGRYKIEITDLTLDGTMPLAVYLMNLDEYRDYCLKVVEGYSGAQKKSMTKRIQNESKFKKDYQSQQDYGKKIIAQIVDKLEQMDLSLLRFIKEKDKTGDW